MDRARAEQATAAATQTLDTITSDPEKVVRIAADSTGSRIVSPAGTYCPARLPCLGRPGQRIAVPVRVITADGTLGEQVGEVRAIYCPDCKTMAVDERDGYAPEQ